ncbi:tyrosine-type recombinase/integrase [Agromyces aerolatus]|uniref:tyrosine-type recombinase/integrase n=1 Tax=Agromyces sp. LY-1074 TaxID=3074080 RepID=UPI00285F3F02|nr:MULTISPECIES: tyrosine-type recombinase/integrase [unclassified Agromyces]MDR5699852.1 tyrosine-type recombinase/integrase [Agromyces sp. LY-1074]MDR5706336.1 tyrosine-type recombinase/integrase [Agromyces sp. LY-1358]
MTGRKAPAGRKAPGAWGTVEQLPSGRYRASYRKDGQKFAAPATFASKDDANAWLAGERADRARGVWADPRQGRVTLADYAATWMDSRPDLSARTRDTYQRALTRWVLPAVGNPRPIELGALDLADITQSVVRAWYAALYAAERDAAQARLDRDAERREHPARAWARARGLEVAVTGRLSPAIAKAWRAAGEPRPHVPTPEGRLTPDDSARNATAHAYRLLRAMLSTAAKEGAITHNPCQIPSAGVVHPRERGTATPAEVASLAAAMPREYAAAVTFAAWSGLRYGELFALARRHVDLDAGTVRVERALVCLPGRPITFGKTKTTKSRRTVHLPAFVLERLRDHLSEHTPKHPDALVFAMPDGTPVTSARLSFLFRRARQTIGRDDLTWHDLRHTGATLAYRAGASVPEVQARLGHATMRAAMIYAHAADDSDRVLADRLDAMYAGTTAPPRLRVV